MQVSRDTREVFLEEAEKLFAERGFYGVSIAAIADQLGLTKQALLHHFGTKEKLYGAVLQRISDDHSARLSAAMDDTSDPEQAFRDYFKTVYQESRANLPRGLILMRELLDNKRRADSAGTWYLKSYLENLTELAARVPGLSHLTFSRRFTVVYQLLGAINYFLFSEPTLRGIFGADQIEAFETDFPSQLDALIEGAVKIAHH
tara:strand:- start:1110 stop:1718 length:609 start_codon:yes stop_codon:yes gene_type:complete